MKHVKTAKILTCDDLAQVLNFISKMIHAERNRALFLITVLGGLSVKETAALLVGDVLDEFGHVRDVIHLRPDSLLASMPDFLYIQKKCCVSVFWVNPRRKFFWV